MDYFDLLLSNPNHKLTLRELSLKSLSNENCNEKQLKFKMIEILSKIKYDSRVKISYQIKEDTVCTIVCLDLKEVVELW